jgi:mitogen-activated protein kinase 1/3
MNNNLFTTKLHDIIIPDEENLGVRALESFNQIFLVINFVDLDLKKIFTSHRPKRFGDKQVLHILYNLLCGINFLHSADVIHRDLKPSNVLIDKECTVTICDFGLARTISNRHRRTGRSNNYTRSNSSVNMSEQVTSEKAYAYDNLA